ncbi:DUF2189 domain-containing protein [Solirhodobacter olei]|uniref:DUF2189 domain-containing protein n=1 Tax=Solirhodobacter olei TaxID=2493082 RepID=UPI000FD9A8C7|nr:DUF2189 domain-containing protein [Solirhodobacter olei]
MVQTIGNPLSWTAKSLAGAGAHVAHMTETLGGDHVTARPRVRRIGMADIRTALRRGVEDFEAMRSDVIFLCIVYPIVGLALSWMAFHESMLPMIFPLVSGFALLGPGAAVGLYQMSRKREAGGKAGWADAFRVIGEPAFGAIIVLGLFLIATFVTWLLVADGIYGLTMGGKVPASASGFLHDVLTTTGGHALIVLGVISGFVFAAVVLVVSVVSFPLLLDRDVGLPVAVVTSVEVARQSPEAVAVWGGIVAGGLVLGAIPALLGLVVVVPILGHATWHLYRAAVIPE